MADQAEVQPNAGMRRVAVRSRFDGMWCAGFEVVEAIRRPDGTTGFQVRRIRDGLVLPAWFEWDEVVPDER